MQRTQGHHMRSMEACKPLVLGGMHVTGGMMWMAEGSCPVVAPVCMLAWLGPCTLSQGALACMQGGSEGMLP